MSYRRRHRWFRRMALGLAFASVLVAGRASVATAKISEDASRSYYVAAADPYLSDVFVRPGESLGGPDGATSALEVQAASTRPDDQANRFAHSEIVPQPGPASSSSTIEWSSALTVGIGAFVLVLALGLAFGYVRRPRLAGP